MKTKIICLCGSTKFKKEYNELNKKFTLYGYIVLTCGVFKGDCLITEEKKKQLDELHKRKIDMSDIVFIINKNDYIGESTKSEIEYAKKLKKEILYYNPSNFNTIKLEEN